MADKRGKGGKITKEELFFSIRKVRCVSEYRVLEWMFGFVCFASVGVYEHVFICLYIDLLCTCMHAYVSLILCIYFLVRVCASCMSACACEYKFDLARLVATVDMYVCLCA
jgi:hypothetical protein